MDQFKLDPEFKAEWLKRLRDPEAKQTRGKLGLPSGERCCLGVACDMAVDRGLITRSVETNGLHLEFDGAFSVPGRLVAKMMGLDSSRFIPSNYFFGYLLTVPVPTGMVDRLIDQGSLSYAYKGHNRLPLHILNDGGATFAEIADLIEEHL